MVAFDRWMGSQQKGGGWGKQAGHLTINQGRQLWGCEKQIAEKWMREEEEREEIQR